MVDGTPINFADMQQPVGPAHVHESAKWPHAAHFAVDHVANVDSLEQLPTPLGLEFALRQGLRHDEAPASAFDLDHLQAQRLSNSALQFLATLLLAEVARHIYHMRRGDKAAQVVELDGDTALVESLDLVLGNFTVFQELFGILPVAALQGFRHTEQEDAVVVGLATDNHIHRLPDFQAFDVVLVQAREVRLWYYAVTLAAHVDQQFGRSDLHDHAFAQVAPPRQVKVQVFFDVLLEQL